MNEDDKKVKIATFRFGVIAEFVNGVKLTYGEKERLISEKIQRSYVIPFSPRTKVSRSSIMAWINDYRKAGHRIEGLYPKVRRDRGTYRRLPLGVRIAVKELKQEQPSLTLPTIIQTLQHKKVIGPDEVINQASLYRYLKQEKLSEVNVEAEDKRRFEASLPNEMWQCDVMHGPSVREGGKLRKAYLCAILDDHSRLIVHGEFYLSENLSALKDTLRKAVVKRGLPQKFYVDNGSSYRALNLEQVTAALGISLHHSRPYTPEGRGKIERWFRTLQDSFLPIVTILDPGELTLSRLNERLSDWVDEYNNKEHGTTKEAPLLRFKKNMSCVRPAPAHLMDYFRFIEYRLVRKDRTFRLAGKSYEAPVSLIDRRIELRFHNDPEESSSVEVFFDGRSYGFASLLDERLNAKLGRDWQAGREVKRELLEPRPEEAKTGELFSRLGGGQDHGQL